MVSGQKVSVNGNDQARVLGYCGKGLVECRLFDGIRHVGDIVVDEGDVIRLMRYSPIIDIVIDTQPDVDHLRLRRELLRTGTLVLDGITYKCIGGM